MTSPPNSHAISNSTLLYAASQGFLGMLDTALKEGANPNTRGSAGYTPLMECANRPALAQDSDAHIQCAYSLLQAGAKVDDTCDKGYTALFYAAAWNQPRLCQLLIERGANIKHANEEGMTVLFVAMKAASDTLFQQLIHWGADVNAKVGNSSVLYRACANGDLPKVQMLVTAGASIDPVDPRDDPPVIGAIRSGDPALLQCILKRGPNLEVTDKSGWSPLMHAVDVGEDIVEMLLDAGASLDGRSGQMALSMAEGRGRHATLDLLRSFQMRRALVEDDIADDPMRALS